MQLLQKQEGEGLFTPNAFNCLLLPSYLLNASSLTSQLYFPANFAFKPEIRELLYKSKYHI